jgi:hypothetical protein
MLGGKTIGVDATTLEANAAMKSIVKEEAGFDRGVGIAERSAGPDH